MYKFEIHLHTNKCSGCAISSSEEMVLAAQKHGYSGIVITNHFFHGNTAIDRTLEWAEFVGAYKEDYLEAKEFGKKLGISVFFGLEEVYETGKEMLIYGIEPEIFIAHPEFNDMSAKQKSNFIHANGGICVCAHPFRNRFYIPDPDRAPDPDLFDGVEAFNLANPTEDNEKAFVYAVNNKKIILSGGDLHRAENFGNAGIAFSSPIKNYPDFISRIKNNEFKLITPFS